MFVENPMPFQSQAQQRFAFGTGQPWAKRWAKETDFAKLPKRVRKKLKNAATTAGPPVAGPGGLLGTPGLGRRWGNRRKDKACTCGIATKGEQISPGVTRIRGNLCNVHGRYGRCPGSGTAPTKPKKGKPTPEQRAQDNEALRRDKRDQVLADLGIDPGASEALVMLRNGEQPDPAALARMGADAAGLVEQADDGSYRMTPSGRALLAAADAGDPGRAGDIVSAARDRKAARTARERDAAQKKLDAATKRAEAAAAKKKPAKGSGGKGSSNAGSDRAATRQQREAERQDDRKRREEERQADRAKRQAEHDEDRAQRLRERSEDRAAMLAERRQRSPRVARSRTPIVMPRNPRTNAVRAKAYTPTRTTSDGHSGVMVALYPDAAAAQSIATADGVTEPQEQLHLTLCFLGDSTEQPLATNKERVIAAIAEWAQQHGQPLEGVVNGLGRFFHSESDDTNAVYVAPDVPGLPELRQSLAEWIETSGFDYSHDHGFTPHITVAYVPLDAPTPPIRVETPIAFDRVTLAWGDEQYEFPMGLTQKSFTVFKSADGSYRWIARSTTAYRDRDGEIITTKALEQDAERMSATALYGPLRYWHIGQPDPFNPAAPWGPGLDIGDCDYSTVIGRTSIESGTFKSAALGAAFADGASDYELSPGFFHPPEQPNAAGEYDAIRRFERSVVPVKYGRASNLFTGMTVKEARMDQGTYEQRVKAYLTDMREKGVPPEVAAQSLAAMEQADKSAAQQGVAFKSDDAPAVFTAPDGTQGLIVDGRFVALKAAEVKADMPPEEMVDAGETEMADGEAEAEAEYVGDMAPMAFRALLIDAFGEAINQFGSGISGKMSEMDDALKAMGYARTKSEQAATAQATEIETLKARLAQLMGDQPAVGSLPADIAEALKSTGPQAPPDPAQPQLPADASPIAHLAARTMPALYSTNPQGAFGGWNPQPPLPPSQS